MVNTVNLARSRWEKTRLKCGRQHTMVWGPWMNTEERASWAPEFISLPSVCGENARGCKLLLPSRLHLGGPYSQTVSQKKNLYLPDVASVGCSVPVVRRVPSTRSY